MRKFLRCGFLVGLFFLLPLLLLGGCFLPVDFEERVEIRASGDFEETFAGVLVEFDPYEKMKNGQLSAGEAARRSRETFQAIAKDPGVKAVKEVSPFRYRVEYLRKGNVFEEFKRMKGSSLNEGEPGVMSFMADLFFLRGPAGGALLLERKRTGPGDLDRFRRVGLEMKGTLSLRVQGQVIEHNAQAVAGQEYRWTIRSLIEPPVRVLFRLN